jgi:hypothetical protein
MRRTVSGSLVAFFVAPLLVAAAPAGASALAVTHDDFKTFLETRDALQDERVQKMPEKQRIPAIAARNFKMKATDLQAIVDKVEAEGGEKGVAAKAKEAILAALAGTSFASRIQEVKLDTTQPHVVTYITWKVENPATRDAEAALIALKSGEAAPITSTFRLIGKGPDGADVFRAKIGQERTSRIKEDRIADWASTRYLKLFEVEEIPAAK